MDMPKFFVSSILMMLAADGLAELKPISDDDLSEISGQAYVSIDQTNHPTKTNLEYTRVNIGMQIETFARADKLELGTYHRWEKHPTNPSLNGTPCHSCNGTEAGLEKIGSDILAEDFTLGYIHNDEYANRYKSVPMVAKYNQNGQLVKHNEGEVVPFEINDPFIEFARDSATNEVVGVRIGFGDAKGILSGNILGLTGAIDVNIRDGVEELSEARKKQEGNIVESALTLLTPLLVAGGDLSTQAVLVDENGNLDPIRASNIGMANGTEFTIAGADFLAATAVPILSDIGLISSDSRAEQTSWAGCGLFNLSPCYNIYVQSEGCEMLGIPTCFPLNNFQSLPIGEVNEINGRQYITDTVSGVFMSFQSRDLEWSTGPAGRQAMNEFVQATSGAFLNLPTGAVEVNLSEVYNGVEGVRREYIDRGVGLF
ncbi:hypothetical protein [Alkalimarinus sediminis]|uniref:Uncharacterized protein n=1 Tax=Alkalimarinus sediminis TaxID=1632866 RepID=A0A9E8KP27_9ALTE|nr:hypothetical protein [Alkalimarinus sediminis]UZW73760.1 hypothetical protein NNL22_12000 [Alkalimarinus sediminis]